MINQINKVFRNRFYSMHSRCNTCESYKDIFVCDEWLDFDNFKADMYDSFIDKYKELGSLSLVSLERISPFDNYCKENCMWIDKRLQPYNKRNTIYAINPITEEKEPLALLCKKFGIAYGTVMARHDKQGMPYEQALIQDVYDNKLSVFDETVNKHVDFATYCENHNIVDDYSTYLYRLHHNIPLDTPIKKKYNIVKDPFTGELEEFKKLCIKYGVKYSTAFSRYKRGDTLDKVFSSESFIHKQKNTVVLETGETMQELSKRINMPYDVIKRRRQRGWTVEEIVSTPVGKAKVKAKYYLPCKQSLSQHCKQNGYKLNNITYYINQYNLEPHEALARYLKNRKNK